MSQFSASGDKQTLGDYIEVAKVYPAGRLDYDSEGLMLLTDDGVLQNRISSPRHKLAKTYWVQLEGEICANALEQLRRGVELKDGMTRPARAQLMQAPTVWPRDPPIRERKSIPTCWVELQISEGRNRQVRRMTAAVGFPTLRLVRWRIGDWSLDGLQPGQWRDETVHLPKAPARGGPSRRRSPPRQRRGKARRS